MTNEKKPISADDLPADDIATDFDLHEWEEWERLRDESVDACAQRIIACFQSVSAELDDRTAWELFSEFAKRSRPKKTKGRHDPAFDQELLAAYDAAPPRARTAPLRAAAKKFQKTEEATTRHLRRLLHERKHVVREQKWLTLAFERWADK